MFVTIRYIARSKFMLEYRVRNTAVRKLMLTSSDDKQIICKL